MRGSNVLIIYSVVTEVREKYVARILSNAPINISWGYETKRISTSLFFSKQITQLNILP